MTWSIFASSKLDGSSGRRKSREQTVWDSMATPGGRGRRPGGTPVTSAATSGTSPGSGWGTVGT